MYLHARFVALLWLFTNLTASGFAENAPLLDILAQELDRNFRVLKEKADQPVYYLAYEVTEEDSHSLSATLGAIQNQNRTHVRVLDVTIRVGTPKLDNYHRMAGERAQFTSGAFISLDDNPNAVRRKVWIETDRAYRAAVQRLIRLKTNTQVKAKEEDDSDDFSPADRASAVSLPPFIHFNANDWTPRARNWSAAFAKYPQILASQVSLQVQRETRFMVNTEGTRIAHGRTFSRIAMNARGKAKDGMDLATGDTIEADDPARLPKDDMILAAVHRVAKDVTGLLEAPEVEPFVGPAILSGKASGVFFHEIFGHRIEGHRQKDEAEGQTFTKSVGTKVLPDFLSVIFDPTRHKYDGTDLNGWYDYDDEGVKANRVAVVEDGVLKTFLLSRSPIKNFPVSNGHGRRQPGNEVVSRQSNLLVESKRKVSNNKLREMLIEEVKRQGKQYGMYFEHVTGGFTTTGRRGLQAFTVIPLVVYRVYPDGRPDELVRGADIVGTPLASFAKIIATSDRAEIFNGYCGAESGSVPVSAVSPAILVSEIEVQKKDKARDQPPLLGRPVPVSGGSK